MQTTTRCARCNRPLRKTTGLGPVCARRTRAEQQYKPAQIDKARELAAERGVVDTGIRTQRGRRVFQVVASNGTDRYFTTAAACTCPRGLKGNATTAKPCYHTLAVVLAA